jgi:hypothetical protein
MEFPPTTPMSEYLRISEDATLECVRGFSKTMIKVFGHEYFWAPNKKDTNRLLVMNEARE